MSYRPLTKKEIDQLLSQNCFAADWNSVAVTEEFSPENIYSTRFEGEIRLGNLAGIAEAEKSISKRCGIYNSCLNNCTIGDHVHISEVKYLSGYTIEDDVILSNIGSLTVEGVSSFGNGTEIEVLNEGGGRELPIFDRLTAQTAYLTVLYRHDSDFIGRMLELIRQYCDSKRSDRGLIQKGAIILDSLIIKNVSAGSYAVIRGVNLLEEGTVGSRSEAPAFLGEGVIAKNFIILSGSRVDGGAILDKCFVGQGVRIGKQFSAENSVFFANSEAFHGEACSLFAGPYSVTHHKSTLLIASLISFFNAGSGTNQSNHMYKLGPLHQGIMERGCKTGSFSYLLLPAHIGAFTVVVGKHYSNFDTSDFPFSYVSEERGRSELTPAMNLLTVGTRRDIDKWPARDRRKDPDKLDLIHFGLFNPYIAGKIVSAISILNDLLEKTDQKQDYVNYKGISIHRLLFKTTRKYYEMALKVYVGQEIVKRLRKMNNIISLADIRSILAVDNSEGTGRWLDVCGMYAPSSKIEELMKSVKLKSINSVDELNNSLISLHKSFESYAWAWCSDFITRQRGEAPQSLTADSLIEIITDWKNSAVKLNNMILKDAEKEFDPGSRLGFGVDGDSETRENDFCAVRGVYDKNKFVVSLRQESKETEEEAERLIAALRSCK